MASFREQIQVYAGSGGFLTNTQERALLRVGTAGYGMPYDEARGALLEASHTDGLVLETAVEQSVGDYLQTQAGTSGRVPRAVFQSAVDLYRSRARGQLSPEQAASKVKDLMLRRGLQPRASGIVLRSRRWFNRIPPVRDREAELPLPPVPAAVRAPVEATLQAWVSAFNARDIAGILALYHPEALLLATAAPEPMRGPAAMRGYFDKLVIAQSATVRFGSTLAVAGNDPAAASGVYEFRYTDPARGPVVTPARFTFVVTHGSGGVGRFLQHHSSAVPTDAAACPV